MAMPQKYHPCYEQEIQRLHQHYGIDGSAFHRVRQEFKWAMRVAKGFAIVEHLNYKKGLSQAKIASAIGLTRTAVVHWCAKREAPTFENIERLEQVFALELMDCQLPSSEDMILDGHLAAVTHIRRREMKLPEVPSLTRPRLDKLRQLFQSLPCMEEGDNVDVEQWGEAYLLAMSIIPLKENIR